MNHSNNPVVRPFAADEWRIYRDLRLRSLAESPTAFSATFAAERSEDASRWQRRLREGVASRDQLPLVALDGSKAIGLAWCLLARAERRAALFEMWVSADHRRLGAGLSILEAFRAWAVDQRARHITLTVSCGNTAAVNLYVRFGFEPDGAPQPLRPGSDARMQPMTLKV